MSIEIKYYDMYITNGRSVTRQISGTRNLHEQAQDEFARLATNDRLRHDLYLRSNARMERRKHRLYLFQGSDDRAGIHVQHVVHHRLRDI